MYLQVVEVMQYLVKASNCRLLTVSFLFLTRNVARQMVTTTILISTTKNAMRRPTARPTASPTVFSAAVSSVLSIEEETVVVVTGLLPVDTVDTVD